MVDLVIHRGDIINVDLEPIRGSETGKKRLCVVISNDIQNKYSPVIIIAIITAWNDKKEKIPFCITLSESTTGLDKKSVVDCGQIRTISKERIIGSIVGKIDDTDMIDINEGLKLTLSL